RRPGSRGRNAADRAAISGVCRRTPGATPTSTGAPAATRPSMSTRSAPTASRGARRMRRTSATGAERVAGFTLVELMVVLVVLGLAAAAVSTSLPGQRDALRDADRFGVQLGHARDEALLGARTVEVVADATGYRFRRRRPGGWEPLEQAPFAAHAWSPGTRVLFGPGVDSASFRFD